MNDAVKRLYQEVIVEHGKSPRHHGPLPNATHRGAADNPLCGDSLVVWLVIEDGRIAHARFEGPGCALSRAAASLMTEHLQGQSIAAALSLGERFTAFLRSPPEAPTPESLADLAVFSGVREFPSRLTCAALPWTALARALGG